jgi:hypothetical protein
VLPVAARRWVLTNNSPLNKYTSTQLLFPRLQADIMDISSGEEQVRQENPTLEAPENPAITVNTLVDIQDLILETPENLAMTVDTLVNLQNLQEPIVTSSAINPSQEKGIFVIIEKPRVVFAKCIWIRVILK